jgi:Fic family protein
LDAISTLLPNPNLFVAMYVRQEAVLSSQIEGTQSTLEDVLAERIKRVRLALCKVPSHLVVPSKNA